MTPFLPNKLSECMRRRHLCLAGMVALVACGQGGERTAARPAARGVLPMDSATRHASDSARAMEAAHDTSGTPHLSPAGDSLAPYLVFVPLDQRELVAASRNKQVLLDVGRMDLDIRKDTVKARTFREIAPRLSPIAPKSVFRLAWALGAEDVVVDSFSVYSGRIVMRVFGSEALDSLARGKAPLVALAVRADSATPPVVTGCTLRAPLDSAARTADSLRTPAERRAAVAAAKAADSAYDARVRAVRDSLELVLRADRPVYERLQRRMKLATSTVRGCFGPARRALVVSLRAGDVEWVRERLVLVAPDGAVTALRVSDLRFRAHDLLTAFDADGDGVDDLAMRGTTERAGGTAVLRVDLAKKRAERVAAGFAWEVF